MSGYAKQRAIERIAALAGQCLDLATFWRKTSEALAGLAAVAAVAGRATEAARHWGASQALHEVEGTPVWPADRREHARYQALARAELDQASWEQG